MILIGSVYNRILILIIGIKPPSHVLCETLSIKVTQKPYKKRVFGPKSLKTMSPLRVRVRHPYSALLG